MARQRRGGFKPPELRGTLGTLLRTAATSAGVVRDAIERGARQGRARLDDLRADRRRQEALAELGEIVLELIRNGEIDLGELPEARSVIDHLDQLDAESDDEDADAAPPDKRNRFDDRGGESDAEDGTVSSQTWRPPNRRAGRPTKVWKPAVEAAAPEAATPPVPTRKGGIQFTEDDDADLDEYMHPDDVPPKPKAD
jgi:hypothetical protein